MSQQRSQKKRQSSQSSQDNVDELAENVIQEAVKIILIADSSKKAIKQSDILNNLTVKPIKKQMPLFWDGIKKELDNLDMELTELKDVSPKSYLLISRSKEPQFIFNYLTHEERADRTLLILVLAYIFMRDGVVLEEELHRHLTNLHILGSVVSDYFGDVKKKISGQFVDQLYISRLPSPGQDGVEIRWGHRANLEVSQMDILEFVCKVGHGGRYKPQNFASQYEKIMSETDE